MKRFIALPIAVITSIALLRIAFAGPEAYSGKEMKQVAPAPLPECNWTGFHIGIQGGYTWSDMRWIDSDTSVFPDTGADTEGPTVLTNQDLTGFFGGGEVGYDYQWHSWVFGLMGDFSYAEIATKSVPPTGELAGGDSNDFFWVRNDWTGSFGLRIGYAWNKFLLYAKGGGAVAHVKARQVHPITGITASTANVFTADDTRWAPMVGVGLEYMINCHWSAKVEYEHDFYGREAISGTMVEAIDSTGGGGPEHETYDIDMTHNTLRFGLNYRF
jgi:outer membrane immunogenic protein